MLGLGDGCGKQAHHCRLPFVGSKSGIDAWFGPNNDRWTWSSEKKKGPRENGIS